MLDYISHDLKVRQVGPYYYAIDIFTKFNTYEIFSANLLLRSNKDRKPMLRALNSKLLFHLIYLFVNFVFIETICTFYHFFLIERPAMTWSW